MLLVLFQKEKSVLFNDALVYNIASIVDECNMGVEQWWNNNDEKKPEHSQDNLYQCHILPCKPHINSPRIEPGSAQWEARD